MNADHGGGAHGATRWVRLVVASGAEQFLRDAMLADFLAVHLHGAAAHVTGAAG
ncbi:MAG: hypothetical protein ABIT20_04990 [Gemmatimonadaceae bacterium]